MYDREKICQDYIDTVLERVEETGYLIQPSVDMDEWLDWMSSRPVRAISPLLDPTKSDPDNTFWLKLIFDGDVVGCIVFRHYAAPRNYFDELNDLGGETIVSMNLGDSVSYTGGLYVMPEHRGTKVGPWTWANHLPRLARAICLRNFDPNWHCGLVVRGDAARGLAHRYGYEFTTLAIQGEDSILGTPTDFVLPYSSKEFMLAQMAEERKMLEIHTYDEGLLAAS